MLVVSRKVNESLVIDDQVIVTVVEIRGDKVRLGIKAPREFAVYRAEVAAAMGLPSPGRPAAEDPQQALEREIAELSAQVRQHEEPPAELRKLLAAKRIELAALRQRGRP
jgi:carbon storage regulator